MRKPLIGITSSYEHNPESENAYKTSVSIDYSRVVMNAGGIPVVLPVHDNIEVINSKLLTKKPKAYMTENPFKDYFICYTEGSYFKGNPDSVKGRVLKNLKKDDEKSIQCLIPFIVGVDD